MPRLGWGRLRRLLSSRRQPAECVRPEGPDARAAPLSRDAVERLLNKYAAIAQRDCPSLKDKHLSPHTLRHYVDGWVMWPAGVFSLLGLSRASVPAA